MSHMNKTLELIAHQINATDQMMVASIEDYRFNLVEFNHAVHIKLAYCYLVKNGPKTSILNMQNTLKGFLHANGVDRNKFHVTLTHAWLKAVWHFMQNCPAMKSSDEFIQNNPALLNKDLLLSHYSHELLFSDKARKKYVDPDLNRLPE